MKGEILFFEKKIGISCLSRVRDMKREEKTRVTLPIFNFTYIIARGAGAVPFPFSFFFFGFFLFRACSLTPTANPYFECGVGFDSFLHDYVVLDRIILTQPLLGCVVIYNSFRFDYYCLIA